VSGSRKLLVGVLVALAAAAVVVLLFTVVFPWFDRTFFADPVIGLDPTGWARGTSATQV
jgi:hypothetical protein